MDADFTEDRDSNNDEPVHLTDISMNVPRFTGTRLDPVASTSGTATRPRSTAEVELLTDSGRPANTNELVGMLKNAGTELTVKYITGELTFEEFCQELDEKTKSEAPPSAVRDVPRRAEAYTPNIPAFDQLLEDDGSEEEEEEEDDAAGADEEDLSEEDADFVDAGEMDDRRDQEWVPDEDEMKSLKNMKGPRKRKLDGSDVMVRKYRKPRRKPHELPKHLVGAQGKAMLLRAQGHTEEAIMLLFDIINKAPKAAAPYQALGSIHEEKGDVKQALKFLLVAANLQRAEPKQWFELIDMCMRLNDEKLALTCYQRAMKARRNRQDKLEIQMHKSAFYEKLDQPQKAMQCQENVLSYMDKSQPDEILAFARSLTHEYMNQQNVSAAIGVLQFIHKQLPKSIDAEDIHLLVELLMSQQSYEKSLEILIVHCGVKVVVSGRSPTSEEIPGIIADLSSKTEVLEKVEVPDLMPVDLRSKLVQSFVSAKFLPDFSALKGVISGLTDADVEEFGDIHYDIAETMVECGYHEDARPILQNLVKSEKFSKAEVWLTYAHCLNALGNIQAAAEAYSKVVDLAPNHYAARVTLSSLQQQMGYNDRALEVLTNATDPSGESPATSDQLLLLHKCQLLHSQGRTEDFISSGRRLLSYNMRGEYSPDFLKILLAIRTMKSRKKFYPHLSGKKTDGEVSDEISELEKVEQEKFKEDMWDVYLKLIRALHKEGDEQVLLNTAILGITCPAFCEDEAKVKAAEFLCLKCGPVNQSVYNLARNLVGDEKEHNQAWNLFSYVVTKFKDVHDLRFAMRALMKNPNSMALGMLNGNARLISGSYKLALGEYLSVFRQSPHALAVLCCALCLLHITSQLHAARRNQLIPQILSLLNVYKEMRGECQEAYYNIGRALYQINLHFAAIHYYKRALQFPPMVSDQHGTFDLTREIAFNLAQIHQKSKNFEAARYYIERYCVI
ncbi:general transcription factor 3C polypeptide 3 [Aplysia californica]|uniref:General transcription factor 3C polypeptide 3 n=1 Tax=Aplysia californica TaxID=6500 RepID=A0ABM0JU27_APLCA|nr:general transcription factor 3C polypeptide 3 [Aplysia californica]